LALDADDDALTQTATAVERGEMGVEALAVWMGQRVGRR
jgi:hypothetical protein